VGASTRAGTAEQITKKDSGGFDSDFTARPGRKNHRRRIAGAFSNTTAQNHLAATTKGRLKPQMNLAGCGFGFAANENNFYPCSSAVEK
jgi:hypothetical protein